MNRLRLTREQQRDLTRQRILDAARATFIDKGFVATTLEDIALTAGYTRGAIYSNFSGKRALFLQLLRHDHDTLINQLHAILDDRSATDLEAQIIQYCGGYREQKRSLLWLEAQLQAGRDVEFSAEFNAFRCDLVQTLAACFTARLTKPHDSLPASAKDLARGVLVLLDGIRLYCLTDSKTAADETFKTGLAAFLAAAPFLARGK